MQLGAVTEVVQVQAAPPIVDTRSTTTGAVLNSELFERVPVGRRTETGASVQILPDPVFGQIYRVARANFNTLRPTEQTYFAVSSRTPGGRRTG
ncbi:MAG TPA: hypothetical protein VNI78_12715 [Vicinamibacterales bacterium]|nr:hypothetical protein [Vicinamibacterales bacterium]